MSDAELRARAREAEESPDDPAAARAWVAAAERTGRGLARALAHLARTGDAAAHERLARTLPWPHEEGHGRGHRLHSSDFELAQAAAGTRLVALEPRVTVREARDRIEGLGPGDTLLWSDASLGPLGELWLATTGLVGFASGRLVLRDLATGAVRASAEILRPHAHLGFAVEFDRALVASDSGGVLCVDLDPERFGRVVWDTRPRDPSVRDYDPAETYVQGDRIRHKKFGEGTVARLAGQTRIVVYFEDDERTLVHGKGTAKPAAAAALARRFERVILAAGLALVEDDEGGVSALDVKTGAPRFDVRGKATLHAADARGVITSSRRDPGGRTTKGGLTELDPSTGNERFFFPGSSVHFLALGSRVLLASRVRRKGWIDRESEREVVALDREAKAALLWRMEERPVHLVTDAQVLCSPGATGEPVLDLVAGTRA